MVTTMQLRDSWKKPAAAPSMRVQGMEGLRKLQAAASTNAQAAAPPVQASTPAGQGAIAAERMQQLSKGIMGGQAQLTQMQMQAAQQQQEQDRADVAQRQAAMAQQFQQGLQTRQQAVSEATASDQSRQGWQGMRNDYAWKADASKQNRDQFQYAQSKDATGFQLEKDKIAQDNAQHDQTLKQQQAEMDQRQATASAQMQSELIRGGYDPASVAGVQVGPGGLQGADKIGLSQTQLTQDYLRNNRVDAGDFKNKKTGAVDTEAWRAAQAANQQAADVYALSRTPVPPGSAAPAFDPGKVNPNPGAQPPAAPAAPAAQPPASGTIPATPAPAAPGRPTTTQDAMAALQASAARANSQTTPTLTINKDGTATSAPPAAAPAMPDHTTDPAALGNMPVLVPPAEADRIKQFALDNGVPIDTINLALRNPKYLAELKARMANAGAPRQ